jgi:hypothetical protein
MPKSCKTSRNGLLYGHILIVSVLRGILYVQIVMHRFLPVDNHINTSN